MNCAKNQSWCIQLLILPCPEPAWRKPSNEEASTWWHLGSAPVHCQCLLGSSGCISGVLAAILQPGNFGPIMRDWLILISKFQVSEAKSYLNSTRTIQDLHVHKMVEVSPLKRKPRSKISIEDRFQIVKDVRDARPDCKQFDGFRIQPSLSGYLVTGRNW